MKNLIANQSHQPVKVTGSVCIWMRASGFDGIAGGKF
jgi:hypothetical protein